MQIAAGQYTGNGVDDRSITGVGFQPDLVIIKREDAEANLSGVVWRSSAMVGDLSMSWVFSGIADLVQTLEADGFQIGTNNQVNASTKVYNWIAFKDNGAGDFKVGTYTGNGVDDRSITGVGFQPEMVWVGSAGAQTVFRHGSDAGDTSHYARSLNPDAADLIQAFQADGFQVGTLSNVNDNLAVYYYVAMKASAGVFQQGTYTGNGADNRSITGVGFEPVLVFVKNDTTARDSLLVLANTTVGETHYFDATADSTDRIQALEADGFQIGTNAEVNTDTETYLWMAWNTAIGSAFRPHLMQY